MTPVWTYVESNSFRLPLRKTIEELESRTENPLNAEVPQVRRSVDEVIAFCDEIRKLRLEGVSGPSQGFLRKIDLHFKFEIDTFFEGRAGPWSCVFWIEKTTNVCIALFCFKTERRILSRGRPLFERRVFANSIIVAAMFGFLQETITDWLKRDKGISIS